MGWFHVEQTPLHSLRFHQGLFWLCLSLTSCHSPTFPVSLASDRVCSWEVNRRLNMLDPASRISLVNTAGTEQEICSALLWICFCYLYIGNCLHSDIFSLSVQPPCHCIEFLRYQIDKNCRHTVFSHLVVETQSSICMRMRRNLH